jgi:hypothetical protein
LGGFRKEESRGEGQCSGRCVFEMGNHLLRGPGIEGALKQRRGRGSILNELFRVRGGRGTSCVLTAWKAVPRCDSFCSVL